MLNEKTFRNVALATLHNLLSPAFVLKGRPSLLNATPQELAASVRPEFKWPDDLRDSGFISKKLREVLDRFNGGQRQHARGVVKRLVQTVLEVDGTAVDAQFHTSEHD